jgi:hypothetical protein
MAASENCGRPTFQSCVVARRNQGAQRDIGPSERMTYFFAPRQSAAVHLNSRIAVMDAEMVFVYCASLQFVFFLFFFFFFFPQARATVADTLAGIASNHGHFWRRRDIGYSRP